MQNSIFLLAVLATTGFFALVAYLIASRAGLLKSQATEKLKGRGLRFINGNEYQAAIALAYASSFLVASIVGGLLVWIVLDSPIPAVATSVGLYFFPSWWFSLKRKKRRKQIEAELPDALLFISSALRAGSALSVALQVLVRDQTGPLGEEFALVLKQQRLGVPFDEAIQRMSARVDIPDFVLVVVALRVAKEVGGNLSEPLRLLAETLRKKAILEGRIQALTAQGRIQGLVMTLFPILLMGVLYLLQPTMGMLFTTPWGWGVLVVVGVMLSLGYAMIRKIVSIDI